MLSHAHMTRTYRQIAEATIRYSAISGSSLIRTGVNDEAGEDFCILNAAMNANDEVVIRVLNPHAVSVLDVDAPRHRVLRTNAGESEGESFGEKAHAAKSSAAFRPVNNWNNR